MTATTNRYLTIRQAVKEPDCPIREGTLRKLTKLGQIPGFYVGSRFLVDYQGMLAALAERSHATVNCTGFNANQN